MGGEDEYIGRFHPPAALGLEACEPDAAGKWGGRSALLEFCPVRTVSYDVQPCVRVAARKKIESVNEVGYSFALVHAGNRDDGPTFQGFGAGIRMARASDRAVQNDAQLVPFDAPARHGIGDRLAYCDHPVADSHEIGALLKFVMDMGHDLVFAEAPQKAGEHRAGHHMRMNDIGCEVRNHPSEIKNSPHKLGGLSRLVQAVVTNMISGKKFFILAACRYNSYLMISRSLFAGQVDHDVDDAVARLFHVIGNMKDTHQASLLIQAVSRFR